MSHASENLDPWERPDILEDYRDALVTGRVYLGAACQADQGSRGHRHFSKITDLVERTAGRVGERFYILEIGSWAGASLMAWDHASRDAHFTVVDPWRPYMPLGPRLYEMMSRAAESGEIYRLFRHNVRCAGLESRVSVIRDEFVSAFPSLMPKYHVVYVDGDHRYSRVKFDIEMSARLVREGGVLCGDDLDVQLPDLDLVQHERVLRKDEDAGITADGVSYHAGVTQAVYDFFERRVSCLDGFWAAQNYLGEWINVQL